MAPDRSDDATDRAAIDAVVETFFAAFASGDTSPGRWDELRDLFLPEAVVVRTCGLTPTVYDVDGFIAPRRALLTDGGLTDFREWVLTGRTDLFGDVAQWFGGYAKAGVQDGTPLSGRGMKTIQLVRTAGGWRISAAAWDDERPGVHYPAT
ncbi:MAG: nuclear transport factor 2 family protein [Lapillicoccus sp.]